MAIHKLANGPITLTVTRVKVTQGNFGEQYLIGGTAPHDDDVAVYVNKGPADMQFGRMGVDAETVVGNTITLSQVKKDGKTFTNIDRADGRTLAPQHPKAPQPFSAGPHIPGLDPEPVPTVNVARPVAPVTPIDKLNAMFNIYDVCLDHAHERAMKLSAKGVAVTHEGIASMAATLYIQAAQKGLAA